MISWPLALICIIATIATLIYVACTEWLWKTGGGYPATEEPKPLPKVDPGPALWPGTQPRPDPRLPDPYR